MSWKEVDPLKVWTNSTVVPIDRESPVAPKPRHVSFIFLILLFLPLGFSERPAIKRGQSSIVQALTEMRHEDQNRYLSNLVNNWPFKWERRAFDWPMHTIALTSSATGMYMSNQFFLLFFFHSFTFRHQGRAHDLPPRLEAEHARSGAAVEQDVPRAALLHQRGHGLRPVDSSVQAESDARRGSLCVVHALPRIGHFFGGGRGVAALFVAPFGPLDRKLLLLFELHKRSGEIKVRF